MVTYELPDLPYAYDDLEPHIDEQTMRLHHDVHHQGYVHGANNALRRLAEARRAGDLSAVKSISRDLSFHTSGHWLHSVFWTNMAPKGETGEPSEALSEQLERDFGGLQPFVDHFSAAAGSVEGSGWGILYWEPRGQCLIVTQTEKHQNLAVQGATPILVLDVWEHAYYLKYRNKRADYVENWWNVVNWRGVSRRFEAVAEPALATA